MLAASALPHARAEVSERVLERSLQPGASLRRGVGSLGVATVWSRLTLRWRLGLVAAAAFLLLSLGLAGGYAFGQSSAAALSGPTTPGTSTGAPGEQLAAMMSGTAEISADTAFQEVFGFVVVGGRYYPQEPCSAADLTNTTWSCKQVYAPPSLAGAVPDMVAAVVRKGQVADLVAVAEQRTSVAVPYKQAPVKTR